MGREIHQALLKPKQDSPFRHAINGNLYRMHKKTAARYAAKLWILWRMLEEYCSHDTDETIEAGDSDSNNRAYEKSPFEVYMEKLEKETQEGESE